MALTQRVTVGTLGPTVRVPIPTGDQVRASEPPSGTSIIPGISNSIWGTIGGFIIDLFTPDEPDFTGPGPLPPAPGPAPLDPLGLEGDCPGLFSIKDPITGLCVNVLDVLPGGDPAVTGPVPANGNGVAPTPQGFGRPVHGRFGVGVIPRVQAQTVRRCPKGMALGKDGVCYDGLGRNSPKREWPMGMKPLLTPGERNAIRIAGRAAGKLARSQKTLKKTARALSKVC